MTTAYTSLLGLALPVTGELSGTWGDTVNTAITSLLDTAVAGTTSITTDADITLTTTTGASNQARQAIILWNPASGTTTRNITAPAQSKIYTVINASGGTQSIVIRGAGPTTGVTIAKGESATVAWNGSDFVKVSSSGGAITFTDLTVTGNTILGDAAADTLTVNATSTFNAPVSFVGLVRLPSTGRSAAAALTVTAPAFLYGVASTYTDTTSSGTIAAMAPFYALSAPTLSTSNVTTYSFASTLYVAGAPAAGGSATITNPYALYVNSGASYLAGAVSLGSTLAVAGATNLNGNVTLGDAAADTVTVNGTITSNLIFTDNTYDIGASGATRPRNLFLSNTATIGTATIGTNKLAVGGSVLLSAGSPAITFNGTLGTGGQHYLESSGSADENFKIRVYNTLFLNTRESSGTYYDRMTIDNVGGVTFKNTGNTSGNSSLSINGSEAILYRNLLFSADNTYNIGASGATRPANIYYGGTLFGNYLASGSNSSNVTLSAGTSATTATVGSAISMFSSSDGTFGSDIHFLTGSSGASKRFVFWNYSGSFNRLATMDSTGAFVLGAATTPAAKLEVVSNSNTSGISIALFRQLNNSNALVINNATGTATQGGVQVLDVGADVGGRSACFVGSVVVGPSTGVTELLNVYSNSSNSAKLDINASVSGQAGISIRAGSGSTYRASRVDFYQTPVSSSIARWTLINDYDQNNTNDMRLYSGFAGQPVQTWKGDTTTKVYSTLGVGNAEGSTSGAGITFPATQSPSSNANTLDEYEEGNWTPTINTSNGNFSCAYAVQIGTYTRIGNFVTCRGYLLLSSISSQGSGEVRLNGLPFSPNEEVALNFSDGGVMRNYWTNTGATQIYGYTTGGSLIFRGNGNTNVYRSFTTGSVAVDYLLFTVNYITT